MIVKPCRIHGRYECHMCDPSIAFREYIPPPKQPAVPLAPVIDIFTKQRIA